VAQEHLLGLLVVIGVEQEDRHEIVEVDVERLEADAALQLLVEDRCVFPLCVGVRAHVGREFDNLFHPFIHQLRVNLKLCILADTLFKLQVLNVKELA